MSTPRPADGVKEAVRRVRLAAASLTNPLGLFGVAAAAAEAVPAVLEPELEALAPSPFGMLAGMIGAGGDGGGPTRAVGRKPATGSRPTAAPQASAGPVTGVSDALGALGKLVTDELGVLGVALAPLKPPQWPADISIRDAGGVRTPPAPKPWAGAPAGGPTDILTAFGFGEATNAERVGAAAAATTRAVTGSRQVAEVAKPVAQGVAAGLGLLEELVTGKEPNWAPPVEERQPKQGPLAASIADLQKEVEAALAPPARPTAPPKPAAAPSVPASIAETVQEILDSAVRQAPTAQPAAAAPPPEPEDLAWLVNEALVEQARRHGVDLS